MQRKTIIINEGNFKTLTFEDYINVLPRENQTKPYKGGYITNCINPLHPDTEPSLHLHPGDDQICIWKCFGHMGCSQETLSIEFNNACQDRKRKSVGLDPSAFNPLATTHEQIMNQTKRSSLRDFLKFRTQIIGE